MNVWPIERFHLIDHNLHRIGLNLLDEPLMLVCITERLGQDCHLFEPLDVPLVRRNERLYEPGRDGVTHI